MSGERSMDAQLEESSKEFKKTRRLAIFGFAFSVFAIWPYLAFPASIFINYLKYRLTGLPAHAEVDRFMFFSMFIIFPAMFLGCPAGLISVVAGIHTLLRLRRFGKGIHALWMGIVSIILGLLSIAANFILWWLSIITNNLS